MEDIVLRVTVLASAAYLFLQPASALWPDLSADTAALPAFAAEGEPLVVEVSAAPTVAPGGPRVDLGAGEAPVLRAPHWDQAVLPATVAPLPTPTLPPPPSPTPAPTWASVEALRAMPRLEWVPRAQPRRDPRNAATILDPSSLPSSLLGVHFAGPELTAHELVTGEPAPTAETAAPGTAWAVEVVYASDERFDVPVVEELIRKHDAGFRILLRIDYERKQPVPPASDSAAVDRYVNTFLRYYTLTGGRVRYFILGNEGNVDAAGDDPGRVTECLAGREACSPKSYAHVYRQVRWALRSQTDAYLLVGATSPGSTAADAARWTDGAAYLRAVLDMLHPLEVDGIALHGYGGHDAARPGAGPVDVFVGQVEGQLGAIVASGYLSTPLFLTELNQAAASDPAFVRGVYAWIDRHNQRSANDILAACWFVYHDETGQWRDMALEHKPAVREAVAGAAAISPGR